MVATGQTTAKMTPRLPHGSHVVKGVANAGGLNALPTVESLLSLDLSAAAVENRLSPWGASMGRDRQTVWVSSSPLRRDVGSTDSLREQLLAWLKGGFG
jgi:hypothetical protein